MKILYGITKSNFGGAQRYVFELATEAKRLGHEVKVMHGKTGHLTDKLHAAGIETISIPSMWRDVDLLSEIPVGIEVMKILRKEKPDVLHINSSKMGGTGAFAVRLMNIYWFLAVDPHRTKAVFTSHGWGFNESWRPLRQRVLIRFFSWLTVVFSHATICVSEKTKQDIASLPFIKRKLVIIRNGIQGFALMERSLARTALGVVDESKLLVGTIGELHRVKGHDILLRAWAKFVNKRPAELVIISDGEERKNLESLALELGIGESVRFAGYMDDARKLLQAFDIYVFPSRSENLPYAILEAGLASRPVIATTVGGIPEIIENGLSGALIPPEDPEALFSTLILLSEDRVLRDRLGSALNKTVKEKFSFAKMVEETLACYKK